MRIEVDCTGLVCPQPIQKLLEALHAAHEGDQLHVIVDNVTSRSNVTQFVADMGVATSFTDMPDGRYEMEFAHPGHEKLPPKTMALACPTSDSPAAQSGVTLLISGDTLGRGSDELGGILMKGFLSTLEGWGASLEEVILINGGVRLCQKGTATAAQLAALERSGVVISLCGTCVDYYQLREKLEAGSIVNMQYISQQMAARPRLIRL